MNSIVKPMQYWIVIAQDDTGAFYNWANTDKLSIIEQLLDSISVPP